MQPLSSIAVSPQRVTSQSPMVFGGCYPLVNPMTRESALTFTSKADAFKKGASAWGRAATNPAHRDMAWGLFYQYGIPVLTGASIISGPVGWLLTLPLLVAAWALSRRGERLVNNALKTIEKEGRTGRDPVGRIAKLSDTWFNLQDKPAKTLINDARGFIPEYNALIADVFPLKTKGHQAWQKRLQMNTERGLGKLLGHGLEIRASYSHRWYARGINSIARGMKRVFFLKPLALPFSMVCHAILIPFHAPSARKWIAQALRK